MTCPEEQEVLRALQHGSVTAELERHVAECAKCAASVRISSALLASAGEVKVDQGDARIIWLLAAERRHAETEKKLARVIRLVPAMTAMIVAGAAMLWVVLLGGSANALLGASGKVGPVFLLAAAFVVFVVWTAPVRGRSR
jgi:hypothetical protein